MKLNIANPATGAQKKIEIEDENKLRVFMERRMAEEVPGDSLGEEFKGYVFKITGGNDKDGFPMRQGVLVNHRVRLLLRRGMPCYYPKRKGEQKRKAVRGCIVGPDISVLSLIIVKRGENEITGLTDTEVARRLGPKRVDKIKKMFNLTKTDDVRDYIVRRKYKSATGKTRIKKPKIQRLITPTIKHRRKAMEKKLINRRRRSFQKRKEYFEKLAGTHKKVVEKKQKIVEKVSGKTTQKGKAPQKGSEKKQVQKKDSGKKDSQKKQPTQQTKAPDAKKQEKKQAKKQPKPKQPKQ